MPLNSGQVLSHYRLLNVIGEGGMGVVWKATDTTLGREVALKVLPEAFAEDPERLARFQREARLLASLNHNNIAAIHGLEEAEGVRFLIMELVSGEGLDQILKREPLSVERTLHVALQVGQALESAHEKGVVHRDLKPANIMIDTDGQAKVLDFGLAKALSPVLDITSGSDISHSPTVTSGHTEQGMIMGTAAYMSPEQARGREVDKRCDIWAFGCLLYECLAGSRIFGGETVSDSLAAILRAEPDLNHLPENTPPRIRQLLERCLVKDPKNRLRDIGDARLELQQAIAGCEWNNIPNNDAASSTPPPAKSPLLKAGLFVGGALAGIALWAGFSSVMTGNPTPQTALQLAVPVADGLIPESPRITPDGQTIVYIGREQTGHDGQPATTILYTRSLTSSEAQPVQGTEGIQLFALSPDGTHIVFVAPTSRQSTRVQISQVPLDGSAPPLAIRDWSADWRQLLWMPDDHILTVANSTLSLLRIPVDGSALPPPLQIKVDKTLLPEPVAVIPGSDSILCKVSTWGAQGYQENVQALDTVTGEMKLLVENAEVSTILPDGNLLVSRHDTLLVLPFDATSLEITGGPVPVMGGLRAENTWQGAWFDLADNGTLVHLPGGLIGPERRLITLEGSTDVTPWSSERRAFNNDILVSRDAAQFAVIVANAKQLYEIWISEMSSPRLKRFVSEPGLDCYPRAWTNSNALIYDCTGDPERQGIFVKPVDGSRPAEALMKDSRAIFQALNAWTISPDGETLIISQKEDDGQSLFAMPMVPDADGLRTPVPLPDMDNATSVAFSPDGLWLAYISDLSGSNEAYLRRFHQSKNLGPEIPLSTQGARSVSWSRATSTQPFKLILTRTGAGKTFAVTMQVQPKLSISKPEPIFDPSLVKPGLLYYADLPDGRWFGVQAGPNEGDTNRISVVLNWRQELERKLSRP